MKRLVPYLSLITSCGTLVCCALPALLVSLGMGATLVALTSAMPQLIWLSEHKVFVFMLAGVMLVCSYFVTTRAATVSCPADPRLAAACRRTKSVARIVFGFSCLLFAVGGFFAFVAAHVL